MYTHAYALRTYKRVLCVVFTRPRALQELNTRARMQANVNMGTQRQTLYNSNGTQFATRTSRGPLSPHTNEATNVRCCAAAAAAEENPFNKNTF